MQCRACLKTNCENSTLLDELKMKCFNFITDLNIHQDDSMPQQLCENCAKDLEFCVKFRDKCITSNSILVSALAKNEDSKNTTTIKLEMELKYDEFKEMETDSKVEIEVKNEYNDLDNTEMLQSEDSYMYEYMSDAKQPHIYDIPTNKSASSKDKTKKLSSKKTRTRAVKTEINICDKKQPEDTKYDCGLCPQKLEKDKLYDHVKSHEKNRYCGICTVNYKDLEGMMYHRVSHLKKNNIVCHICLSVFRIRTSLEYHYNVEHLGNIKDATRCRECNQSYNSLKSYKKHRKSVHNDTDKTYECKECSKIFHNYHVLRYHKMKVHVKQEAKVWSCEVCDYSCKAYSNYRDHKIKYHSPNKVCCKLCDAWFNDESRLKLHKCRYSANSICPVCGIVTAPRQMRRHLTSHSDERKHKCDRCDATYKTRGSLRVHLNKHDGVRAHQCEYCPASFFWMAALIKHRRVHTGEKPYVCKVCSKGFTGNHNLKVHMKVHGVHNLIKKKGAEEDSIDNESQINTILPVEFPDSV